jgi:transposase InsO family protein
VQTSAKIRSDRAVHPKDYKEAVVYLTARSPLRLLGQEPRAFEPLEQPDENYPTIMIDVDKTFQTIEGFGGAFTDATADNFAKLSPEEQERFLIITVSGGACSWYRTLSERSKKLEQSLERYFQFYNQERPHQSLNYATPVKVHYGV